jgi:transposase
MHQNILLIQDNPARPTAVRETLLNLSDRSFQIEWVGRCREGLKQLADRGNQNKERLDGIAAV